MRTGTTVFEWMQDHDVRSIGIDVRRFASFGVIKARRAYLLYTPIISHFHLVGFPSARTPLADPPSGRRTARGKNHDTTSLADWPPQAREQLDCTPARVLLFHTGQTAHLRRDASIRNRKRALD
jgi:hypothetical protein